MSRKPLSIHDPLKQHLPSGDAITLFQPIMSEYQTNGKAAEAFNGNGEPPLGGDAEAFLKCLLGVLKVEGSEKRLPRVGAMVAGAAQAMEAVMEQLEIKPDEQQAALAELLSVVERRFRQFVTALLIEALLPGLQRRAVRHFRRKFRESEDVALDLSQTMVVNILGALNGRQPNGNAGAWVATICHNVYADHVRKRDRGRQVLSNIEKAARSMRRL
ncbi:MAG TPA: sigma factor [Gemmataceae bacterium]|jgi:hypothetical protein|nr:sigma factor [Gemmataceae bacterium]